MSDYHDLSQHHQVIDINYLNPIEPERLQDEITYQVKMRLTEIWHFVALSKVEPKDIRIDIHINRSYPDGE
jgi:hypothetical protein